MLIYFRTKSVKRTHLGGPGAMGRGFFFLITLIIMNYDYFQKTELVLGTQL